MATGKSTHLLELIIQARDQTDAAFRGIADRAHQLDRGIKEVGKNFQSSGAQISGVANQIGGALTGAAQTFTSSVDPLKVGIGQITTGVTALQERLVAATGAFGGLIAAVPIVAAIAAASQFLSKSLADAAQETQNLIQMTAGWKATGRGSEDEMKALVNATKELSRTSSYASQDVIDTMKYFVGLKQISTDQLLPAIKVAMDFAAYTGRTIQEARYAIGYAATGQLGMLREYGFTFTRATEQTRNFNDILREMGERVSGQEAARMNTYTGAVALLGKAINQVQKAIGHVIEPAILPVIQDLVQYFKSLGYEIETALETGQADRWVTKLRAYFKDIGDWIKRLVEGMRDMAASGQLERTIEAFVRIGEVLRTLVEISGRFIGWLMQLPSVVWYAVAAFVGLRIAIGIYRSIAGVIGTIIGLVTRGTAIAKTYFALVIPSLRAEAAAAMAAAAAYRARNAAAAGRGASVPGGAKVPTTTGPAAGGGAGSVLGNLAGRAVGGAAKAGLMSGAVLLAQNFDFIDGKMRETRAETDDTAGTLKNMGRDMLGVVTMTSGAFGPFFSDMIKWGRLVAEWFGIIPDTAQKTKDEVADLLVVGFKGDLTAMMSQGDKLIDAYEAMQARIQADDSLTVERKKQLGRALSVAAKEMFDQQMKWQEALKQSSTGKVQTVPEEEYKTKVERAKAHYAELTIMMGLYHESERSAVWASAASTEEAQRRITVLQTSQSLDRLRIIEEQYRAEAALREAEKQKELSGVGGTEEYSIRKRAEINEKYLKDELSAFTQHQQNITKAAADAEKQIQALYKERLDIMLKVQEAHISGQAALDSVAAKAQTAYQNLQVSIQRASEETRRAIDLLPTQPQKALQVAEAARQKWVALSQDIKSLENQLKDVDKSYRDFYREMAKTKMTTVGERYGSDIGEVQRLMGEARKAQTTGDYELAQKRIQEAKQLAMATAREYQSTEYQDAATGMVRQIEALEKGITQARIEEAKATNKLATDKIESLNRLIETVWQEKLGENTVALSDLTNVLREAYGLEKRTQRPTGQKELELSRKTAGAPTPAIEKLPIVGPLAKTMQDLGGQITTAVNGILGPLAGAMGLKPTERPSPGARMTEQQRAAFAERYPETAKAAQLADIERQRGVINRMIQEKIPDTPGGQRMVQYLTGIENRLVLDRERLGPVDQAKLAIEKRYQARELSEEARKRAGGSWAGMTPQEQALAQAYSPELMEAAKRRDWYDKNFAAPRIEGEAANRYQGILNQIYGAGAAGGPAGYQGIGEDSPLARFGSGLQETFSNLKDNILRQNQAVTEPGKAGNDLTDAGSTFLDATASFRDAIQEFKTATKEAIKVGISIKKDGQTVAVVGGGAYQGAF